MSMPPPHRSLEEAVEYEAALCERMALAGPAAQRIHLRRVAVRERSRAAAAQAKPQAGHPPPAQQDAGRREPTPAQVARKQRSDRRLRQKHLAQKLQAAIRIADGLYFWHRRAATRLARRYSEDAINVDEAILVSSTSGEQFYGAITQFHDKDWNFHDVCTGMMLYDYDRRLAYYDECRRRAASLTLRPEDEAMPPPALTGPAAKSRGRPSPGPAPLPPPADATAVVAADDVSTPSTPSPPPAQPAVRRRCLEPSLEAAAAAAASASDRPPLPPGLVPLPPPPPLPDAAHAPPAVPPAIAPEVHAPALPQAGTAPPPLPPTETAAAVPADAASFATPRRPTAAGRPGAPDRTRSPRSPSSDEKPRGKGKRPPRA